jgi:hypothetical protein
MKKIVLVAAVATFALGMTSCKKDYTCSCTATDLPSNFSKFEYSKVKKDDAESTCSAQQTSLRNAGYSDASCKI